MQKTQARMIGARPATTGWLSIRRNGQNRQMDEHRRLGGISEFWATACRNVAKTTPTERRATPVPMESQRSRLAVDVTIVSWWEWKRKNITYTSVPTPRRKGRRCPCFRYMYAIATRSRARLAPPSPFEFHGGLFQTYFFTHKINCFHVIWPELA